MEKRNVMKTGVLWHEVVSQVHEREYKDVQLEHMLADAGGMQLVRWPKQFDVIVTDNLFGDMLSDVAAMLTGSLGMLPSASLGSSIQRPGAARRCMSRCTARLRISPAKAWLIRLPCWPRSPWRCAILQHGCRSRSARGRIAATLAKGLRTADIKSEGVIIVSTSEMGEAIVSELDKLAA